jgi:hypothetical protein
MGDASYIDNVVTSGKSLKYVAREVGHRTIKEGQTLRLYPRNL